MSVCGFLEKVKLNRMVSCSGSEGDLGGVFKMKVKLNRMISNCCSVDVIGAFFAKNESETEQW